MHVYIYAVQTDTHSGRFGIISLFFSDMNNDRGQKNETKNVKRVFFSDREGWNNSALENNPIFVRTMKIFRVKSTGRSASASFSIR